MLIRVAKATHLFVLSNEWNVSALSLLGSWRHFYLTCLHGGFLLYSTLLLSPSTSKISCSQALKKKWFRTWSYPYKQLYAYVKLSLGREIKIIIAVYYFLVKYFDLGLLWTYLYLLVLIFYKSYNKKKLGLLYKMLLYPKTNFIKVMNFWFCFCGLDSS